MCDSLDEEDLAPLVRVGGVSPSTLSSQREVSAAAIAGAKSSIRLPVKRLFLLVLAIGFCVAFKNILISYNEAKSSKPFRNVAEIMKSFQDAKRELWDMLSTDYGPENFRNMFLDDDKRTSRGRTAFVGGGCVRGWDRMKRKVTIKLLQVLHASTSASDNNSTEDRRIPFVWATCGHSAAAGHGNFFNQSYTAFLDRAIAPIMNSVGIRFVGRNYAVGAYSSGPEVALCEISRFGNDIDVLTWDYGMTGTYVSVLCSH
jgi:hypothetical protein